MGGFNNPIVAGRGSLVYPSIHSPNFVAGVSGWSINKDGTAQFFGLLITGGIIKITGPTAGLFAYDPSVGAGNLIGWLSDAATDPYGNAISGVVGAQNNATTAKAFMTKNADMHLSAALFTGDAIWAASEEGTGLPAYPAPWTTLESPMQSGSSAQMRFTLLAGDKEGVKGPFALISRADATADYGTAHCWYVPGTGVDDGAALNALMALGILRFTILPGTLTVSTTITVTNDQTKILGCGTATVVQTGAGWTAGAGTTPVFDVRARDVTIGCMKFGTVNGWAIQHNNKNAGGGLQINHQPVYRDLWFEAGCAGGLDLEGNGGNTIGALLSNIIGNSVGGGTAGNLDCIRIQDAFDISGVNISPGTLGGAGGTTGHGINLLGHCANVRMTNVNCGGTSIAAGSGSAGLNIADAGGGHSSEIYFINGVFQTYDNGMIIPGAANDIHLIGCEFRTNNFSNAKLTGSGFDVYLTDCTFAGGGQAGAATPGTYYDLDASGTVHFAARGCNFASAIVVSGSIGVQFSVNIAARNRDQSFPDVRFTGAGAASTNWFPSANQFPRYVKINGGSPGLTPRQPAIALTTVSVTNDTGFDAMVYIVPNSMTVVTVDGTALSNVTTGLMPVLVPANGTIALTYAGAAPTWQWFAL